MTSSEGEKSKMRSFNPSHWFMSPDQAKLTPEERLLYIEKKASEMAANKDANKAIG